MKTKHSTFCSVDSGSKIKRSRLYWHSFILLLSCILTARLTLLHDFVYFSMEVWSAFFSRNHFRPFSMFDDVVVWLVSVVTTRGVKPILLVA